MNSIIKSAAKITGELNKLNGKSDAKQDEMQQIGGGFKEEMEKQSDAWAVH